MRSFVVAAVSAVGLGVGLSAALGACTPPDDGDGPEAVETGADTDAAVAAALEFRQGGLGSTIDASSEAFSLSSRSISHYERQVFADGKDVFEAYWVAGGLDDPFAGLGPAFDATACSLCHVNDGRGAAPEADGPLPEGMVVKLRTDDAATLEAFGPQLQRYTTEGEAEATVSVTWEEVPGTYDDGTPYTLRRPTYTVTPRADLPMPAPDAVLGPRVAPQLSGMGLLELISVDTLQAQADPDDADDDGISGRLGPAFDPWTQMPVTGRFGWQAETATVEHQTTMALMHDMGLTSRWFPSEDCVADPGCYRAGGPVVAAYGSEEGAYGFEAASSSGLEVSDQQLYELTIYTQALAVPAIRDTTDPEVVRGAEVFEDIGCSSCHAGPYVTERGAMLGLSYETIHPRTDLLLHDLGEGLGDQTVAGEPVPTEWRTPPLWGIGLISTVNGQARYLHDGRARSIEEAVLWHGGEAEAVTDEFLALPADDREALLLYLSSL